MRKQPNRNNWDGYLTTENYQQVAAVIEEMLTGHYYTFVSTNEKYPRPDVRTSQRLEPQHSNKPGTVVIASGPDNDNAGAHITVVNSYGVWVISSYYATEREAREAMQTKTWSGTAYIVFKYSQIEIEQYNGYGERLYWCIALERHENEEE